MKKFLIIAMMIAGLTSCFSEESSDNNGNGDCPVEIKLTAGVYDMITKAPVNAGSSVTAGFVSTLVNGDYTTNTWTNVTGTFTAAVSPAVAVSFNTPQYYPVNDSAIYVKGYNPVGTVSGKTVTFTTTDGSNDVMISNQASGRKVGATALAFTFNHLLTQLQFKFVAGNGYPTSGVAVTSLTVNTQQVPQSIDLNTGTITYTSGNVSITGNFPISSAGTNATTYLMVKSGVAITLNVTTSDGVTYTNVPVTVTGGTVTGSSHLITLTFTPNAITATAIVTAWVTGGTGTGTVS